MELTLFGVEHGVDVRDTWMPDPGVYQYVFDVLKSFGIQMDVLPRHWLPIGITGTMDWIKLSGWWILKETDVLDTKEQYEWLHSYDQSVVEPDVLRVFSWPGVGPAHRRRLEQMGLSQEEQEEALGFVMQDVYEAWFPEGTYSPAEREDLVPPRAFVEYVVYATFLWVTSEYGADWIRSLSPVFERAAQEPRAYLVLYEDGDASSLLENHRVSVSGRRVGTCCDCGVQLPCVGGYLVDDQLRWDYLCRNCARMRVTTKTIDITDGRVLRGACPKFGGTCGKLSCPHNGEQEDPLLARERARGQQRLAHYRDLIALHGTTPRAVAGQSVDSIVAHYHQQT